VEEDMPN
jgi:hypothetical protein